jgi:hypothetical protein
MQRRSVALFLSTLSLLAGTAACRQAPEAGEQGGDTPKTQTAPPPAASTPAKPDHGGGEGGEGEGGEGGEG